MAVDSDTTRSVVQTFSYWERAAEQLENKEPSVFAALLELRKESSCPSKDMPSEISQIIEQHINTMENKQWSLPFKVGGREVKIRKQLDNVWKVLQIFNTVGYTLASVDPVHVGIPWAGVSFIVQGALNDSAQNIAAMEGLSQISLIVDRYLWMETIYLGDQDRSDHEDFEKCLVDLYAGILKYQVAAACHCKRSTFSRFLRALPKVDDWAAMLQYIDKKDKACKDLASVLDSLNLRIQDKRLEIIQSTMQGNQRASTRVENARILSWICEYIPGRDHQDIMVHKKMGTQYAHSCQWLFDHHEFVEWRFRDDHELSTLWVCGAVGTGKTSLVSRVIEWHLQEFQHENPKKYGSASHEDRVDWRFRQADPEHVGGMAYFYCVRQGRDQSGTDLAVILRSLVRQLAWSLDGSTISPLIRTVCEKLGYERPGSGRLSPGECSGLLTELISFYSNTTIILDALDECEKPYELLRELKTIANSSTGRIKLFVSSRLNINVASVVIRHRKIDIQSQGTSKDMDIFLRTEVKERDSRLLKGRYPELEDRLIKVLKDRAQGMFRWAELQLAIFLDENSPFRLAEDVISKLDRLDEEVGLPDLDLVYDEIYQKNTRIGTLDRENNMKTFKFLLYSFVEWNVHDLATAISLKVDGTLNLAIDASYILDICSNFLIVDHSEHVQFAHLSVPEYLKGGRSAIVFSDIDAHAQIAEICLAYLMSPSAQKIVKKREVYTRNLRRSSSSEESELGQTDTQEMNAYVEAIMTMDKVSDAVPSSQTADLYYDGMEASDPLGLHMYAFALCLAHCELASMVKRQEGTLCRLFTAFMSTVEFKNVLLTCVPDRWSAMFGPVNPRNWTAQIDFCDYQMKKNRGRADPQDTFFAACIYGFTEILRDMRSIGSLDVDRRNKAGVPGLCLASRYGQLSVVGLLLDEGANSNIRDGLGSFTPLHQAVRWSQLDVILLLLSHGADASARFIAAPKSIVTPGYSDASGHSDDADDGVDGEYEDNETLLHAVAYKWGEPVQELKMPSIVSLLLEHGLLIDVVDSSLQTPLHIACSEDNLLAVSTLLHHGASPGARDRDGYTPLMFGVNNSTAAMELSMKKASITDIVRRDNDAAHSVLSLSLQRYKPDATMLLLNTVDLRAARELDTQEGEEFVELLQVLKKIGYGVLDTEWEILRKIAWGAGSQHLVTNCLRIIAEKIDLGKLDWYDADFRDKLQKEGFDLGWIPPDTPRRKWFDVAWDFTYTLREEGGDDMEDDDDPDDDDDADDDKDADDDDDTDNKNP